MTRFTTDLDKSGRIVLPKRLRDKLQLEAGVTLEIESAGETITLRPRRRTSPLRQKEGIWVFTSEGSLTPETVEETLQDVRNRRHDQALRDEE